jgi:O-antigen ligase
MKITGFRNYKIPLLVFAFSVLLLTIYSIFGLIVKGIPFQTTSFENGAYILRYNFEQISNLHPAYYSIFAIISCSIFLFASKTVDRTYKVVFIIFSIILFAIILFLAARIALITAAVFLFILITTSKLSSLKKFSLAYISLVFLILISFTLPSSRSRLNEIINLKTDQFIPGNTVSQRVLILDCTFKTFSENIFFGSGSGHSQKKLDECYNSKGWQAGAQESFNPHNQFLSVGINYGVIMILVFIVCLFIIFRKIFKLPEGKYYCIAIIMFFMSESLLEVQMGVYLFGLISLLLYNINIEPQLNKKP